MKVRRKSRSIPASMEDLPDQIQRLATHAKPVPKVELPMIHERLVKGVKEPMWDLYTHGVTQGLLAALMSCPEKARLQAVEGLAPLRTGGALSFGSVFHEALDLMYTHAMKTGEFPDVPGTLAGMERRDRKKINESKSVAPKGASVNSAEALQEMENNYGVAEPLLVKYLERWMNDLNLYRWQALEERFGEVDDLGNILDNCAWTDKQGRKIRIRGKFDGVFRQGGKLWLFETKTKARIDDPTILQKIGYDLQVNLYLWAIRHKYGEFPEGVLYNLVRRPQLIQGKAETLKAYCERIRQDLDKRSDFYFTRITAAIPKQSQLFWEKEFNDMMQRVVDWYEGRYHYRDSNACASPWACQYLPICSEGNRAWFRRKDDVYPELLPGGDAE